MDDEAMERLRAYGERRPPERGAGPLLVLALAVLVPAVVLFALWRFADSRRDDASAQELLPPPEDVEREPAARLRTGLLSFRRVPELVADEADVDLLRAEVEGVAEMLEPSSCVTVTAGDDGVLAQADDVPVIPASTLKVVVGAVALEVLGRDHRFTTTLAGTVEEGVATGDLHIVGGGDPLLTSADYPVEVDTLPVFNETLLDDFVEQLAAAGVTRVEGNVVGDGSRYDDERYAPDWAPEDRGVEAGPIDALLVNDSRVTGEAARAEDPNVAAASELVGLLERNGIEVGGAAVAGATPEGLAELASVQSVPMPGVVAELLTTSDNNTAELLLKELGRSDGGGAGTREGGLAVVRRQLEAWGADLAGVTLTDASGLSASNRMTCSVIETVLLRSGHADDLAAGMPIAGETGALTDVFVGTPVEGRLVAKTGTLRNLPIESDPPGAKGLAGYLATEGEDRITFTLLLNGPTIADPSVYAPTWDALAAALATYPAGPDVAEVSPRS